MIYWKVVYYDRNQNWEMIRYVRYFHNFDEAEDFHYAHLIASVPKEVTLFDIIKNAQ